MRINNPSNAGATNQLSSAIEQLAQLTIAIETRQRNQPSLLQEIRNFVTSFFIQKSDQPLNENESLRIIAGIKQAIPLIYKFQAQGTKPEQQLAEQAIDAILKYNAAIEKVGKTHQTVPLPAKITWTQSECLLQQHKLVQESQGDPTIIKTWSAFQSSAPIRLGNTLDLFLMKWITLLQNCGYNTQEALHAVHGAKLIIVQDDEAIFCAMKRIQLPTGEICSLIGFRTMQEGELKLHCQLLPIKSLDEEMPSKEDLLTLMDNYLKSSTNNPLR